MSDLTTKQKIIGAFVAIFLALFIFIIINEAFQTPVMPRFAADLVLEKIISLGLVKQ